MSFARSLCALSLLAACIAGCGGSSSGGGSNGGGGSSATTVTFAFRGTTPTAAAAKVGSAGFTAQSLNAGALTLSIPSGTTNFAVAFVCPPLAITSGGVQIGQTSRESVFEATTADGTSFTEACAARLPSTPTGTLSASVDASAIANASFLTIEAQAGDSGATASVETPAGSFSFAAPAGSDRVEAVAFSEVSQGATESFSLVGARNFSGQAVPGALNGGNPVVLGSADQTTSAAITYNGVPSGFATPSTIAIYEMAGGGGFLIADAATSQYPVLPAGAAEAGDSYVFESAARNGLQTVSSFVYASAGGPVSFTFPAPWSYTGPTPAALPTLDFSYAGFAGKSGVTEAASIGWSVGTYSQNTISTIATASYQGSATTLAIPDLSGITGFFASPPSGTQVVWLGEISQNSWGALQAAPSNATANIVQNGGAYNVP
ncbi:MAG: hypothetical protein WCC26_08455 [Terracidiphilus sp.]